MKVKKRDAVSVDYDEHKIYIAIEKAVKNAIKCEDEVPPHIKTILNNITSAIDNIIKGYAKRGEEEVDVETIQDLVEQQLMGAGLYDVVRDGKWDDITEYIWENRGDFTGISMLAASGDKLYQQAPHEEVSTPQDETLWNKLISKFHPVDFTQMKEAEDETNLQGEIACADGACELV